MSTVNLVPTINMARTSVDTSSWTIHNAGGTSIVLAQDSSHTQFGPNSLHCTGGGGGGSNDAYVVSAAITGLTAGASYTASVYLNCTVFTQGVIGNRCLWFTDGTNNGSATNAATTSGFTRLTGTIASLSGTSATVRYYVILGDTYFTDLQVETGSSATAYVDPGSPVNSVAGTVSGTAPVGSLLTATNGSWNDWNTTFTYTYQWTRDGSNIGGATSSTYTTVTADATHAVGCTVTATNGVGGTAQASSNTVTATGGTTQPYDGSTAWTLFG